ncbi:hypothetical protein N7516_007527 [Penicillium verrucosum]|uniref:uncharacterized protein n=1 Tax=Penicillium verrucosum TaxID=60171 RepID=UPI00254521C5|nr:uncharacterized protein N7516_007527 [Penicillium verrucosum]KAJ5933038.1 hypothetical protein N7516_007527 [Penicillium verrucosum]
MYNIQSRPLGERAIEVRKVAGSIPARPISFCFFPLPTYLVSSPSKVGTSVKWGAIDSLVGSVHGLDRLEVYFNQSHN